MTLPVPFSAQWMEWHPQAHVLLAGTADGNSWMWKIPSGDCKTFQGPACPATCGKILPDGEVQGAPVLAGGKGCGKLCLYLLVLFYPGKRAVVGYEDGTMRIWDLKQGTSLHVLKGGKGVFHLGCIPCAVNSELCLFTEAAHAEVRGCQESGAGCSVLVAAVPCHGGATMGWVQCRDCRGRRAGLRGAWSFCRDGCSTCLLFISTGQDGHQDPLTCVASNQDGSLILTGSVDCHAKLVNSATGKVSPCPPVGHGGGYG